MISLGCAKNLVDAEIMLGSVRAQGMEITASAEDADVLIVNTCAFIDSAKEESIEAILQAHEARGLRRRPGQKLIVSGCMAQRFSTELADEMREVDAFMGLDQVAQAGEIVRSVLARSRRERGRRADVSRRTAALSRRNARTAQPRHARLALHPGLGHAALPPDARAHGLRQDRRGLQPSVQLLRDPADARAAPFAHHRERRARGPRAGGRGGQGNQPHQPGHDLLRHGPLAAEGRAAPAGGFRARADPEPPARRTRRHRGRLLGAAALHASGALERRTDRRHRAQRKGRPLRGHAAPAHPPGRCSTSCAAKPRANTSRT